jgi:hypothetical protein
VQRLERILYDIRSKFIRPNNYFSKDPHAALRADLSQLEGEIIRKCAL